MKSFEGKIVLLTGAASGIGRLMALMMAEEKPVLALADINKKCSLKRLRPALQKARSSGHTPPIFRRKRR
ncbi:MAG TPA: hypothetical protein PLL11_17195 [Spirochaetota bacterium]|nr:hypothetical protein [Spirochaetota bacterium]